MFPSTPDAYDRPRPGNHWSPWDQTLKGHWLHTGLWLNRPADSIEHSSVVWASCAIDHLQNRAAMGKQNMYDHSIRIPLLMTGPGIPAGRRVEELVYQHSVFPTTCELAGIPIPKMVEFPSLTGMLWGSNTALHESVFSFYQQFQRAVRTKIHKLIVYPQAQITQLFDMVNDPWEMRNLADEPLDLDHPKG